MDVSVCGVTGDDLMVEHGKTTPTFDPLSGANSLLCMLMGCQRVPQVLGVFGLNVGAVRLHPMNRDHRMT